MSHGFQGDEDLAVYVGQTHPGIADEIQLPDAAAGQGFYGIAADTADANTATRAWYSFSMPSAPN